MASECVFLVFKICCNHIISKDQKLNVMSQSDRAWTWHAVDFSEEAERQELFAIKFKSSEIAQLFKQGFEKGQKENVALGSRESFFTSTEDM